PGVVGGTAAGEGDGVEEWGVARSGRQVAVGVGGGVAGLGQAVPDPVVGPGELAPGTVGLGQEPGAVLVGEGSGAGGDEVVGDLGGVADRVDVVLEIEQRRGVVGDDGGREVAGVEVAGFGDAVAQRQAGERPGGQVGGAGDNRGRVRVLVEVQSGGPVGEVGVGDDADAGVELDHRAVAVGIVGVAESTVLGPAAEAVVGVVDGGAAGLDAAEPPLSEGAGIPGVGDVEIVVGVVDEGDAVGGVDGAGHGDRAGVGL